RAWRGPNRPLPPEQQGSVLLLSRSVTRGLRRLMDGCSRTAGRLFDSTHGPVSDSEAFCSMRPLNEDANRRLSECHLERLVRLFARTCLLWTLLTEARAPFDAFIGAGGCSSEEAMPPTESIFLLSANKSPTKLKKRNAIAFCASSPSRAA